MIILLVILAALVLYGVSVYNKLVRKRNNVEEGWSGIDVQLKKRYNLIPNLVETIKGYTKHEQETLENVIQARNQAQSANGISEQMAAEKQLNSSIGRLFAIAESYPDLKANTNFLQLQSELSKIEGDIEKARRYYNGTVRENNNAVEMFPGSIFANMYGFGKYEYFEIEFAEQRENPKVQF